jgi:uroporphyrinogen-III synthase
LRDRRAGLKFPRQFPIGSYVVDFYCFEVRLAVELDGSAHSQPNQVEKDRAKDAYLTRLGIRVLRLPNGQVMQDPEGFVEKVRESALSRIPSERPLTRPAPAGESAGSGPPSPHGRGLSIQLVRRAAKEWTP